MKTTIFLTLLGLTTMGATAATLPVRLPPTRPRDAPQHRLALLHTLTPSPPSNSNFLVAAAAAANTESTKGGAILTLPASDQTNDRIATAQGTFRVPSARMPTTGPTANNPVGMYAASFWVGIDSVAGNTGSDPSCGASLRAGVDIFWDGTIGGTQTPVAWYQFGSAASEAGDAVGFEGFKVAEGDVVRFTLEGESPSSEDGDEGEGKGEQEVVVVAENFGGNVTCAGNLNGATPVQSVRQVVPVPAGGARLCGGEAAWVVEDFPLAGMPDVPVALANFTSVTFAGVGVALADGTERDVAGAEVLDVRLEAQGGRLTSCKVVDGNKVRCARVVGDRKSVV